MEPVCEVGTCKVVGLVAYIIPYASVVRSLVREIPEYSKSKVMLVIVVHNPIMDDIRSKHRLPTPAPLFTSVFRYDKIKLTCFQLSLIVIVSTNETVIVNVVIRTNIVNIFKNVETSVNTPGKTQFKRPSGIAVSVIPYRLASTF